MFPSISCIFVMEVKVYGENTNMALKSGKIHVLPDPLNEISHHASKNSLCRPKCHNKTKPSLGRVNNLTDYQTTLALLNIKTIYFHLVFFKLTDRRMITT